MPAPLYIQFVQWAEAQVEPFTYLDVDKEFCVPRELVVHLVSLAVEKGRVERVSSTHWRFRARGYPGKVREAESG